MQTATIAEKPRKQAISGRFWARRTYSGVDVNYVKALMTNSFQIIKEAGKGLIPGVIVTQF